MASLKLAHERRKLKLRAEINALRVRREEDLQSIGRKRAELKQLTPQRRTGSGGALSTSLRTVKL